MTTYETDTVVAAAPTTRQATENPSIRPFTYEAPQAELDELRRRIVATRFPEKEAVADDTQGVQLATIQKLARYWATEHDWRKVEAKMNSYPHFITEVDGLDIHFIHVRSKHENALALIVTHGWPGSIVDRAAQDHRAPDQSDGPWRERRGRVSTWYSSMPGYGFSGKPATAGWGPERIARSWATLMERLGVPALRRARRRLGC